MGRRVRVIWPLVVAAIAMGATAHAQDLEPTGWIVFEHFGQAPDGSTPAADADWSPDGTRIVYSTVGYRESEGAGDLTPAIFTVNPDGSSPRRICVDGVDVGCMAPTWMPDGDTVMYWGFRTWNLMDWDGEAKAPIDEAHLTWFADGLGYGYFATWAPAR